jgi:hypothetical protein
MKKYWFLFLTALVGICACTRETDKDTIVAQQWNEISIELLAEMDYANPYTDVEVYAIFTHETYGKIRRPAFWDGSNSWKMRFASPVSEGSWQWESVASESADKGLHGQKGKLQSAAYSGDNPLIAEGLLRMSPGKRNVVHANGKPFIVIGDTPWALPWRATLEDAKVYAEDRQSKGFNAALLMSFCPDTEAQGPDARATLEGFARAFEDIEEGHINKPVISYFQYFDQFIDVLIAHEIVPVYQPIFHGYGWKGQKVLGWDTQPDEYERYMKYLIARYGARPAFWLVGGDGDGRSAGILEAGIITQEWDDYQQPALEYITTRFDTPSERHPNRFPHENKIYQDQDWLDFQWCQTGHGGEHQFYKVEKMYDNLPTKAVANGEPTYEGIRDPENGAGWWQGHEAWGQFTSGGTMGVVYGAGGIWQWKISADEEGWPAWANSVISWRDALHLEGSIYVGFMKKALEGLDLVDIEKRHDLAGGKLCLAKAGKTYLVYLPEGGEVELQALTSGLPFTWFNPKTAEFSGEGTVGDATQTFTSPDKEPWVLIVGSRES